MDESPTIELEDIAKAYRIWRDPSARLKYPFLKASTSWLPEAIRPRSVQVRVGQAEGSLANRYFHDFYALRDITFSVQRGEAVGIVGRNGSGKSTLLQIIAQTLSPTTGSIRVRGRVAALLELGSGFNPEFTGRENVMMNGTVLGLTRAQILERFDSIAAFADIGEFIDQPVKTYSSGMQVRLAFAVAAHVDPEILIIDEALAVGDARFQLKCHRAIDRFVERGTTFLFVSHDLNAVKRLCSQAILLEQGRILYRGKPNDVANLYSKLIADGGSAEAIAGDIAALRERRDSAALAPVGAMPPPADGAVPAAPAPAASPLPAHDPALSAENTALRMRVKALETELQACVGDANWKRKVESMLTAEQTSEQARGEEYAYGGELGRIVSFKMQDDQGEARTWFTTGENVEVRLEIEALSPLPEPIFAMTIKDRRGLEVYGTNTLFGRQPAPALEPGEHRVVRFCFPVNLMPGDYILSLGFTHFVGEELVVIHRRYDATMFSVHGTDRCFGIANCFATIAVEPTEPSRALGDGKEPDHSTE